jgi:hypothetical protein
LIIAVFLANSKIYFNGQDNKSIFHSLIAHSSDGFRSSECFDYSQNEVFQKKNTLGAVKKVVAATSY